MRVPVAVYRWFEQGGAWAYDPLCAAHFRDTPSDRLDELFDPWLKALTPGSYVVCDERKQWWVFLVERDEARLDPRTREGESFILRAALLPRVPEARGRLEALLRQHDPRKQGEDASLTLEVGREVLPRRWGCSILFLPVCGVAYFCL